MITTQYMTSFTPEEMKLMVEQGAAKDARIAELEAQLAAAQERERVYQEVYGELPDDIESTYQRQERELAALRAKLREQPRQIKELTAALAAAQKGARRPATASRKERANERDAEDDWHQQKQADEEEYASRLWREGER